jgi:phosphohistidine phosphatase SixA
MLRYGITQRNGERGEEGRGMRDGRRWSARLTATVASLALALAALVSVSSGLAAQSVAPTVVIVVRHAEKAAQPANDPPLTPTGVERAQALVLALADAKVDVVIHTPTVRTRETARPTAEKLGITPEILPLGPMAVHAAALAEMVRKHPGKTILVVGHSNTIMPYLAALGGPTRGNLCDHEYNGMYTLVLDGASARLVESRFGPPNPAQVEPCNSMRPATRDEGR